MQLEKTMFREYDIRGRVNEHEMNEASAKAIAKGFATMLRQKQIAECVVGHDFRSYSPLLKAAFVSGLSESGINVIDLGMVLTPITYFAQFKLKIKACAMVTASHNPNGWSGFKLGYDFSKTLLPDDIKHLYEIIENEDFIKLGKNEEKGKIEKYEKIIDDYIEEIKTKVKLNKNKRLRIVINARNGTASKIAPRVFRELGCEVIEQFCELNAEFPNGEPNPSLDSMLNEIGELVRKEKADIGIGFDGDGDRVGIVDEQGNAIYADKILALLARLVLQKQPGAKIVFDVKCSKALEEDILAHNGIPIMWKTGHSYIKQKAHEEKAPLAGERSGHIFFMQDYYGFDDGIFASAKLLEFISNEGKKLSKLIETIPKYYSSPVLQAPCADEIKYKVVERIVSDFKKKFPYAKIIDINGARVEFSDGWGLVRASSNVPALVLVFEAKTPKRLKEIEEIFRKELSNYKEISPQWENG